METLPEVISDIVVLGALFELRYQEFKFSIFRVLFERNDRDAVCELLAKGIDGVVNKQDVLQLDIFKHAKVFDVFTTFCLDATIAIEPMLDKLASRVKIVDNGVRVLRCARRENADFVILIC